MKVAPRFLADHGPEIFTGNELLLKGALETEGGVHLLGGYPGSPISGFFDSLAYVKDLLSEKGIRAVINNNEALAVAMLNGSQVVGCRGMVVMKSVGVHVASDALALGNLAGAHPDGGAIVVYGDDPWSDSTQVAADSRYLSKHHHTPVIEPANMQEIKDFIDLSFKLSAEAELYAGFILPNNLADGGGTVQCRPNQYPAFNTKQRKMLDTATIDLDKFVLLPPKTWWQEASLASRFARAKAAARRLGLNRIDYACETRCAVGFITSGLAHGYLLQSLGELGMLGRCPVLKLGMTYPVDETLVRELAAECERIVVIEERRGFIEEQVVQIVTRARQAGRVGPDVTVWGKAFPHGVEGLPEIRGLSPSIVTDHLARLFEALTAAGAHVAPEPVEQIWRGELENIEATASKAIPDLPPRVPTFCPGCPHRDSADLCLEIKRRFMDRDYMCQAHDCDPVDLVFHGDIGCYTMLMFPPNTPLMHNLSGMGLGAGTGSGMDPFITNKQVVFMGDSTFFHCGALAISQAVKLGQDITFIILDNSTTAMTGHQPTPGVEYDIMGNATPVQSIDDVVNGIVGSAQHEVPVVRTDPAQRPAYRRLLEQTFLADGVKVIIADKECGITRGRRRRRQEADIKRKKGFLPSKKRMNINHEICRFCLACVELTGCPGLAHVETEYGRKMGTDLTACVNDGACERVGACSSFEQITIKRRRPPVSHVPELALDDIPEPEIRPVTGLWRCCLVGVGGMGIGVGTSIVLRAGHKEGYNVQFVDKKGLAIRNGAVVSQVVYNVGPDPVTALVPYGKADLLIGVDILEAVRAMDPKGRTRVVSKDTTSTVVNTAKVKTIPALIAGSDDFDVEQLVEVVRANTGGEDFMARNSSRICEKYLGSKMYANVMMLGFAFQKGLIPVSMHAMAWAIKDTIRTDFKQNLYAFNMGRKLVTAPDLFLGPPEKKTQWRDVLEDRCRGTIRRYRKGSALADKLRSTVTGLILRTADLDEDLKRAIVVRAYDCMRWGGVDYARRYLRQVREIYEKDRADYGFAATRAVVFNLAAAMLIKDLVFIAELATSPEKYARDRRTYNVHPTNGDRIRYRHKIHTPVRIGRRQFTLNFTAAAVTLKVIKRMRWLRKLPGWNREELYRLAHYEQHVAEFAHATQAQYRDQVRTLSSSACHVCDMPRCRDAGCPLENAIPEWIGLAEHGRWREASEVLHATNNFPEFTAEVCPAPCQTACKRGINGYPVQIRDIERQIAERAFAEGWIVPVQPTESTSKRVAIVGSGPAGLAAAQQLARAGHDVTVFEADREPGGLLQSGIPDFRLDKALVTRRLEQLKDEGIEFRTGVTVGRDIPADRLLKEYDAICLATGATRPRDLDVPGRDSEGVYLALDYLRNGNGNGGGRDDSAPINARGKAVVVIGGGETGSDCVETALRQGARRVHQLEILPEYQVVHDPTHPESSGVDRRYCAATKAFQTAGHTLKRVTGTEVAWSQTPTGQVPAEVPDTEFSVDADLAVLALGFDAEVAPDIAGQLALAVADDGRVVAHDFATSVPGVFVAGDLATGPSLVAGAIGSGRGAAAKIDQYLRAP